MKILKQIQEIKDAHNYNYSNSEDRANYFERMNVRALSVINFLQEENKKLKKEVDQQQMKIENLYQQLEIA